MKKLIHILGITTCCLMLSGCGSQPQKNESAKEQKLSEASVKHSLSEANKAIDKHEYQEAFTILKKVEEKASNKEDKSHAKQLSQQLEAYNKAYQASLNATDGKESKAAAQDFINVIKMDADSSVAKQAIKVLSNYQKTADLYPGNLTIKYDRMVIAKKNDVKQYEKAEFSSKSKKIKKNASFRAQDICYIDGTAYYSLYLDDKRHSNSLKRVGYAKAADFETVEGTSINQVKTLKKSTESHIQFLGGDTKRKLKKGQKYYVTYKYECDGKTIYSINETKNGKAKKDKDDRYIWCGYVEDSVFQ